MRILELVGADIPLGTRIAFLRRGRGLSQLQLATRAGVSVDYVSMLERGLRSTPSTHILQLFAQVLQVSLDALRGHGQVTEGGEGHPVIPRLTEAMLGVEDWSPAPGLDLASMQDRVELLGDTWFGNASFDRTAALLPEVIREADYLQRAYPTPQEEPQRRQAALLAYQVYNITTQFASDVGALDASVAARERMLRAAEDSDDLIAIASCRWLLSLKLIRQGYLDASERILARQLEELRGADDVTRQALTGMTHAAASVVAVRQRDIEAARDHADAASRTAQKTGEHSIYWSAWGPTNAGIYQTEIAAEYGDARDGLRASQQVTPQMVSLLPIAERRAHYLTHIAWLYDQLDEDTGVILHLKRAQREAPEEFPYSRLAQQLIVPLMHRARSSYYRDVAELAEQAGMALA